MDLIGNKYLVVKDHVNKHELSPYWLHYRLMMIIFVLLKNKIRIFNSKRFLRFTGH
jgi:hypothetical protein